MHPEAEMHPSAAVRVQLVAALAISILLGACAGRPAGQAPQIALPLPAPQAGMASPLPAAAGPLGLPAPSALASRTLAFTLAEGHQNGADFDAGKPNNRASTAGATAVFAPDFTAATTDSSASLAFAIYDFHLPNYGGALADIQLNWTDTPNAGSLFVALGDFAADRWVWFANPPQDMLSFAVINQYLSPADHLFLVVAVTGTSASILADIQISEQQAPTADLTSDVDSGVVPLTVNFDASGSADADGTIATYEWDFNGDDNFTQTVEEVAAFDQPAPAGVTYSVAGTYNVQVRVTDDDGKTDVAQLQVNATNSQPPVAGLSAGPATSGDKPLPVDFDATASMDPDGTVDHFAWDFDGDNNFGEAGAEAGAADDATPPTVSYTAVGTYNPQVRVTDNDNNSDVQSITLTVTNAAPQAGINAVNFDGSAPLATDMESFSADFGGTIVDYEWDFDGDGVFNEAATQEETERGNTDPAPYTYTVPGDYHPALRVTDDDGATDVASIDVHARGWLVVTVDSGPGLDAGYWGDIALVNGNPAMAYRCNGTNEVHYAYSATATGAQASDWTKVVVPKTGLGVPGREISLAVVNGNPAMAYCDNAGTNGGDLVYQRATTPTGGLAADWIDPVIVQSANDEGYNCELLQVGGAPAIAFDDITANDLKYAHATTMTGASGADWTTTNIAIDTAAGGSANGCSLALVSGNPAVVYHYFDGALSNMRYCRSTTASGDSAADWGAKLLLGGSVAVTSPALGIVSGNPAVAYQDANTGSVHFQRATNATGSAWNAAVTIQTGMGGSYASLAIVGGFPAAAYHDNSVNNDAIYTRSTQADGSSGWGTHETVAGAGNQGRYVTLILVDGGTKPALYFRDDSGQSAKYAVKF